MKKLLLFLTLFLFACTQPTPKGSNDDKEETPLDPYTTYAYDGNGTLLGTVEGYNKTYAEVRTSKGFLDLLQYNGLPFAKGNEGASVSPADQDWLFYIISGPDYYIVPPQGTTFNKLTIVYTTVNSGDSGVYRYCMQNSATMPLSGSSILFYNSMTSKEYVALNGDRNATNATGYLQYNNGKLTTTVQGYMISMRGCIYNEDIGYPPAVDGKFAVQSPVTLKRGNGTVVKP